MKNYGSNTDSTQAIDHVQTIFECCGKTNWLDWSMLSPPPPETTTKTPDTTNTQVTGASTTTSLETTTAPKLLNAVVNKESSVNNLDIMLIDSPPTTVSYKNRALDKTFNR